MEVLTTFGSSTHAPAPMAELVKQLTAFQKPAKRPEHLPPTILWTLDDSRSDPDAAPSPSNPSRPNMEMSIRQINGRVVTHSEYKAICATVNIAYRVHLESIGGPDKSRPAPLQFLRTYHNEQVDKALNDIENAHPQVSLCAFHWKGLHLLQYHIQNRSNSAGRRLKKKITERSEDPPSPKEPTPVIVSPPPSTSSGKRKTPESQLQHANPSNGDRSQGSSGDASSEPAPKRNRNADASGSDINHNAASFRTALDLNSKRPESVHPGADVIHISHIHVDTSCTWIRRSVSDSRFTF